MISHKHKFIFIHINKTGGTSIETAFSDDEVERKNPSKHATAIEYRNKFGDKFLEYFKFTIVRNPWDWLVSRYFWCKDDRRYHKHVRSDFKNFMHSIGEEADIARVKILNRTLIPQHYRILDESENQIVDFVGRFENLQEDFNISCDRIGIPHRKLPHKFKTKHKHYTEYYDDETREIVAEKYAKDIEYFGYEYEV